MSDKSSGMPEELKIKRDELSSACINVMTKQMGHKARGKLASICYETGFDKCFELMSAAIKEERQSSLESYSDLDDINCDLNWKLKEAAAREAKLKAQLYDAEEILASVLENMEHYKETECIPTDDEINQVRNTLKSLILSRIEEAGNE